MRALPAQSTATETTWQAFPRRRGRALEVDDPRVDPDRNSAHAILDLLTSKDEPELYDRTLVQFGEAMDMYVCRGYLWGEEAVFLFWHVGTPADQELMGRLDAGELAAIASAAAGALAAFDSTR